MKPLLALASLLALSIFTARAADLVDAGSDFHLTTNLIATAGDFGSFQHRLLNTGDGDVGQVDVNYYLSVDDEIDGGDVQVASEKVGPIREGNPDGTLAAINFQFPVALAAGSYFLLWEFPLAGDEESRDNIGAFASKFTVRPPADFDLRPHGANAFIGGGGSYNAGTTFLAVAQATNDGPDRSSGFTADWFLSTDTTIGSSSDIFLAKTTQASIAAPKATNAYREVASLLTIPADTAPGEYNLGFRLSAVRDNFPANNTYRFATKITVVDPIPGYVDLANASGFIGVATQFPAIDSRLGFNARVRNIGDSNSGNFTVQYYASENLQTGDGDDVLLATEEFAGIPAAPSVATTYPTRTIDADLPMSGLSVGTPYYLYYVINGGGDDNAGNNTTLLASRFIPSTRTDLELRNFRIRDYEGNEIASFPAASDFRFQFSGTIENHSLRDASCKLKITFNKRDSNKSFGCFVYFLPESRPADDSLALIPGNTTQPFEFTLSILNISDEPRNIGTHFIDQPLSYYPSFLVPPPPDHRTRNLADEFGWWQGNNSIPTYDVVAEVVPMDALIEVPDATPGNNLGSVEISAHRFEGVSIRIEGDRDSPIWNLSNDLSGYPTVTAKVTVFGFGPADATFRLQHFANGVPFGDPSPAITLSHDRRTVTLSSQLPNSFPAGATQFSIGAIIEPGSPEEAYPGDNYALLPYLVNVGTGGSLLPDLADYTGVFRSIPDALNPGTESSTSVFPIRNIGQTDAPASRVSVFLSEDSIINANTDILIGDIPVPAIPAGLFHQVEINNSVPDSVEPGDYYLAWQLNSSLDFPEASLANNTVLAPKRVQVGTFVNLAPGNSQIDPFTLSLDYAAPGAIILLEGGERNGGNISSGEFRDAILLSTDAQFSDPEKIIEITDYPELAKASLPAGSERPLDVTFALPLDLPTGVYYVRYMIDYQNSIPETSEADNVIAVGTIIVTSTGEAPPPEILTLRILDEASVFFRFTSRSDRRYQVALSSDLSGSWYVDPAQSLVPGTGGIVEAAIHNIEPQLSAPAQFFRIEEVAP